MLIWGSGGKVVELGPAGNADCATCEKERAFRNVLAYRYAHIWYLFSWVTRKQYMTVCEACNNGTQHDTKRFEATLGKSPIPVHRRFGGLALLVLILALVGVGMISASRTSAQDSAWLSQPQVGDLYEVDLQALVPDGYDGRAYGVMRVAAVDGQTVALQPPRTGYDKWKGADRDVRGSRAQTDAYYVDETIEFDAAQLRTLHERGKLKHVVRR